MGRYTEFTRKWLDQRYRRTDESGIYHAHQPVYGRGVPEHCEPHHLFRLARQFQILRALNRLQFETFLDVGGSEGYGAHLVRGLLGARVAITDLSVEACKRAADLFDVPGFATDGLHLPFADDSFDVVLCTEVLEHVEHPVEMLLELRRVAKRAVIVTSEEITTDAARAAAHRPPLLPHIERNLFHTDDFAAILGDDVQLEAQQASRAPDDTVPDAQARAWIKEALADPALKAHVGALVLLPLDPEAATAARVDEETILDEVLAPAIPLRPFARRPRPLEPELMANLRCPATGQALRREGDELLSVDGAPRFEIDEEVPVLFVRRDPTTEETRVKLMEVHGGDAARVEAALVVRQRLETPVPPPRLAWDFSELAAREEWLAGPGGRIEADEATLRIVAEEAAPFLIGPPVRYPRVGIVGFEVDIEIDARTAGGDADLGRIWWIGPDDEGFAPARSVTFPLPAAGERAVLQAPLAGQPNEDEDEHDYVFRLDPLGGPGVARVHRLAILRQGAPSSGTASS